MNDSAVTLGKQYDIVILGAGLAGLSLCRHLLLRDASRSILLIDNKPAIPGKKQKVGESLVQVAGYYFSKVLDLEEYLCCNHYMKYNLRFYWQTAGQEEAGFETYCQSYIRTFSNICCFQLDRNRIEEHLLELNRKSPEVTFCPGISALKVDLSEDGGPHLVRFRWMEEMVETEAEWVVDTSGRGQLLKRKKKLQMEGDIRHGASWCWVEGLVNFEKLTARSPREIRINPDRRQQGMSPAWLATNHFCGEGFWFWVIPLHGITSLGLVYDSALIRHECVSTPEKLIEWACRRFPLFRPDLPNRRIVDGARLLDYAYDCRQTISPAKWAMSGMAGRFTDPLYSPGSDLISFYNSMIVDTILESDAARQKEKCELYESLMKVIYEAYVPSYATSYDALGDQEAFSLKYAWELAVYFSFYVFPFMNDLFTENAFVRGFFRKFAQLGPVNRNLHSFLSDFFQWKKAQPPLQRKIFFELTDLTPLQYAQTAFYEIGISPEEAGQVLDRHLENLKEFARFIFAYVSSVVLEEPDAVMNRRFVEGINLLTWDFDVERIRRQYATSRQSGECYAWKLNPCAMDKFRSRAEHRPVPAVRTG